MENLRLVYEVTNCLLWNILWNFHNGIICPILNLAYFFVSQFWRLDFQKVGPGSLWNLWGRIFHCLCQTPWDAFHPWHFLFCSWILPISASVIHGLLPMCLFLLSSYNTSYIILKAHSTPVWPHLTSTNYIWKDLISK